MVVDLDLDRVGVGMVEFGEDVQGEQPGVAGGGGIAGGVVHVAK